MHRFLLLACTLSCLLLTAPASRADIMVGGIGTPAGSTHPLSQFSSLAQGTMMPSRQISGPNTQLHEPNFGIYEPNQQLIYISDFRGQAIRVFPAFASGDVAPIRVINSPQLGQVRANAPVFSHNELGVIVSNCCIATYPLDASGNAVQRIRSVSWGGFSSTELNNPFALIYLPATDEFAVLDHDRAPPHKSRIVFHSRTANGDAAPTRLITGLDVVDASGMAYDPVTRRIFVLRTLLPYPQSSDGVISVFDDTASGNAVALHTMTSNQLNIESNEHFTGLGFDAYTNRLMVSSTQSGNPARNRIATFNAAAIGPTTPIQMLNGANLSAHTVGVPFGVPSSPPAPPPLIAIAHPTALAYGQTSVLSWQGGQGNGAVSFSVTSGMDVCEVSGSTLSATGVGACVVTATKAAEFLIPEQTASVNLSVTPATQAPLIASATPAVLSIGGTSLLTTQGGSGTGAVHFQLESGFGLCALQGTTLTALAPGSCTVRAYKAADAHHHTAGSEAITVIVNAGDGVFADGFEAHVTQP